MSLINTIAIIEIKRRVVTAKVLLESNIIPNNPKGANIEAGP